MVEQFVITEKSSQAKEARAAIGSNYGHILPVEEHLLDLQEPEEAVPDWKRWAPILLRQDELYETRPAKGGNKAAKLKAIQQGLRTARNGADKPLTTAQLSYAKNIAQADGIEIPDEARKSSAAMSSRIEQQRGKKGRKGRAKPRSARERTAHPRAPENSSG